MSAVATSSGVSTTPFKRPRTSSSDDDANVKRTKYFYVLAPETTEGETSDGSESVYSLQGQTTDLAKDTSDTSSKSDDDSMIEFEVVSLSDDDRVYPFPDSSSSSPEDLAKLMECDTAELLMSSSESNSSSSVTTENHKDCRRLYSFTSCVQCGRKNPIPFFRFCDKCYKVRKNFFPPRPKPRKPRSLIYSKVVKDNESTKLSGDSGLCFDMSENLSKEICEEIVSVKDSYEDSELKKELCGTCLMRPIDGGFVHKNIVHVYSCYKCSSKIVKQRGRCPICNYKVSQAYKLIIMQT